MSEKDQPKENQAPSPIGEIEHGPSGLEAFLDANQKKLVFVGCFLIIASIAYVVTNGLEQQKIENSSAEISAARELSDLRTVYEKYQEMPGGLTALDKIAAQQWADQRQLEAIETLKKATTEYLNHPAIGSIHLKLASYHRALGEKEEAQSALEAAAETDSAISSEALFQLADLLSAEGKHDEAKAYLEEVVQKYGERHPSVNQLAKKRQELIGIVAAVETSPATPQRPDATSAPGVVPDLPDLLDLPEDPGLPSESEILEVPAPPAE